MSVVGLGSASWSRPGRRYGSRSLASIALFATCCLLLLPIWVSAGSAQDVQRFFPASGSDGFLELEATRTPGAWHGSAHLFTDLAFNPVEYRTASGTLFSLETRLMLHVGLELGIWGRGAVAVRLPMILLQEGHSPAANRDQFALSDPQLLVRYRLLGASMADRNEPHDGPGLGAQIGVAFPQGRGAGLSGSGTTLVAARDGVLFASDDSVRTDVSLQGDFQLLGAGLGASLGWRHHFWDPDSAVASFTSVRDELTFGAAIKLPIPALPVLAGVLEFRGATGFRSARDTPLELDLGARLKLGDFVIVLGGGVGLNHAIGTPDGRILLGLYGTLPESDQDHDGISDSDDGCAYLAEDFDSFQDGDGCPDPDNDSDLVPDLDDKCPDIAAEEGRDDDEDGCTDPAGMSGVTQAEGQ